MKFRPTKGPSSQVKKPAEFRNPATAIVTASGNLFVNYHGLFFLFFTPSMKYLPWKRTKTEGILPNVLEYGRLHGLCKEKRTLAPAEEILVWRTIIELQKDMYHGLTRAEVFTAKQAKLRFDRQKRASEGTPVRMIEKRKTDHIPVYHSFEELRQQMG